MSLLVIEPWCIGGKGVRRRPVAERTAIGTVGIVDAVRFEGAASTEGIGGRVWCVGIRAEFAEVFGMGGERTQQELEEKNRHRIPPAKRSIQL